MVGVTVALGVSGPSEEVEGIDEKVVGTDEYADDEDEEATWKWIIVAMIRIQAQLGFRGSSSTVLSDWNDQPVSSYSSSHRVRSSMATHSTAGSEAARSPEITRILGRFHLATAPISCQILSDKQPDQCL